MFASRHNAIALICFLVAVVGVSGCRSKIGPEEANMRLASACRMGNPAAVDEALRLGANPNSANISFLVMGEHSPMVVDTLLKAGANPNATDNAGITVLGHFCENAPMGSVQRLVEGGAKMDVKDGQGRSIVQVAASLARPDLVRYFLSRKADVNAIDEKGWTPLHEAVISPYDGKNVMEVVRTLIASGANLKAIDRWHRTPYALAIATSAATGPNRSGLLALLKPKQS